MSTFRQSGRRGLLLLAIGPHLFTLDFQLRIFTQRVLVRAEEVVENLEIGKMLRERVHEHRCRWDPPGQNVLVAVEMFSDI